MKRKLLIFILSVFISLPVFAAKRALIIAIGEYKEGSGWSNLASVNDIELIKNALLNKGFQESNISLLTDRQATKNGILRALDELFEISNPGDIVVIHYSGHGQQVEDLNGDEADGLDEAIVPHDGLSQSVILPDGSRYINQNHLIDDELEVIINKFRNKLGSDGQLLFILDSCHSGSASRGDGEIGVRGGMPPLVSPNWKAPENQETVSGSGFFKISSPGDNPAPFIMISGAAANERNYEYGQYGSLSYALAKAMNDMGTDFTYRQLFAGISAIMNGIAPRQNPVIEGDVDYKLFKGEYVKQAPYFDVSSISFGNQKITINGGQINSIFNKTTVLVMPHGSTKADESKAVAKGMVTNAGFGRSEIELDTGLENNNPKNYWAFIDKLSYGNENLSVNVYIDKSVKDESIKKGIADFLTKENLGETVSDLNSSDIILDYKNGEYVLSYTRGEGVFGQKRKSGSGALKKLTHEISQFARGSYLKNLSFKTPGYEFEFELIRVNYDSYAETVSELPASRSANKFDIFRVEPDKDFVVLEVKNTGDRNLYISIVEINASGEIAPFFPGPGCELSNDDRLLKAGKTMRFNHCVFGFAPPYERLLLKGFASNQPLNFDTSMRGEQQTDDNPLKMFLDDTVLRAEDERIIPRKSHNLNGYTAEFLYEIVEKK